MWFGGVSAKTVGNWEKSVGAPDARQLSAAISHGVDVMYLLTGARAQAVEAPPASYRVDPPASKSSSPPQQQDFIERALHAALLNTIMSSRKHGHKLTTDQFIRVVHAMFLEYLKELESGAADIGGVDDAPEPGQTGTHG